MLFSPRPSPQQWEFIYSGWTVFSYAFQVFGVVWILWGGGLSIWVFATERPPKQTFMTIAVSIAAKLAAIVIPSAALFFGGLHFRRWIRAGGFR